MSVEPYRQVLRIPGARTLLLVGLVARIPELAMGVTLTLHVVNGMGLGFLQAGLVGAVSTGGLAVGAPVVGRFVDRYGLRPVVAVTTAVQLVFWSLAAFLPYWLLLGGTFADGLLALPVFSVIRQCLTATVPAERRRTAFALDSMLIEMSYMIGPTAAVAATTALGSGWTMPFIGVGLVGAGAALYALNPPTRAEDEPKAAVSRRRWLTPALLALLGLTFATTFVVASMELSLVAVLKADGATRWTGLAIALLALTSLAGGFIYGGLRRGLSPLILVGAMGALTLPVGLIGPWPLLCLALIPAGMLCSPSISTTIDALSQRVSAPVRGQAVGLHRTALTLGLAASGPITGSVIDGWGPAWSFAIAGLGGILLAALAAPLWRGTRQPTGLDRLATVQ